MRRVGLGRGQGKFTPPSTFTGFKPPGQRSTPAQTSTGSAILNTQTLASVEPESKKVEQQAQSVPKQTPTRTATKRPHECTQDVVEPPAKKQVTEQTKGGTVPAAGPETQYWSARWCNWTKKKTKTYNDGTLFLVLDLY